MPDLSLERRLYQQGISLVAGVDEAGRGPLAGPVLAAAVILPRGSHESDSWLCTVNDSKKLSVKQREQAARLVLRHASQVGVGQVEAVEIDRMGIGNACIEAMMRAVAALPEPPQHLLLDFVPLKECRFPFEAIVKGDSRSYSIAAASIVAKVIRDRLMEEADAMFPGYAFSRHKGYPTAHHLARLRELGPCLLHRRSFRPVREVAGLMGTG